MTPQTLADAVYQAALRQLQADRPTSWSLEPSKSGDLVIVGIGDIASSNSGQLVDPKAEERQWVYRQPSPVHRGGRRSTGNTPVKLVNNWRNG